jgi:hypothetical protein
MFRLQLRSALLFASVSVLSFSASFSLAPAYAATKPERLPELAAETSAQFELAYRSYPAEGENRQVQLNAVLAAWRSAPRTEANNERLTNWLHAAIRASMPGSRDPLPPAPSFATNGETEKRTPAKAKPETVRASEPTPATEETTQPKADSPKAENQVDPFQDDPADKQATK